MTAGKGFIALAALIFAKWRPLAGARRLPAFGLLDAVAIRLQGVALPGIGEVPVQADPGLALCHDGDPPRRLHRQGDAAPGLGIPYVKER